MSGEMKQPRSTFRGGEFVRRRFRANDAEKLPSWNFGILYRAFTPARVCVAFWPWSANVFAQNRVSQRRTFLQRVPASRRAFPKFQSHERTKNGR